MPGVSLQPRVSAGLGTAGDLYQTIDAGLISVSFVADLLTPGGIYQQSGVVPFQAISADHFRLEKAKRAWFVWLIPQSRVSQVTAAEGVT